MPKVRPKFRQKPDSASDDDPSYEEEASDDDEDDDPAIEVLSDSESEEELQKQGELKRGWSIHRMVLFLTCFTVDKKKKAKKK
jgi:hypothetical protein